MKLFKDENKIKSTKRVLLNPNIGIKKSTIKDELEFIKNSNKTKICIYRGCGGIGDILMITPLFEAIKNEYPDSIITFAIDMKSAGNTYYDIIKNNPFIDSIISVSDCKKENYHLFKDISSVCLQYENSGLKWINRIDIFANSCGFKLKNPKVFYKVEDEEREWAKTFLSKKIPLDKKTIMLHTASYDKKRTWPIEKYTELIKYLNSKRDDLFYLINDFQQLNKNWSFYKNTLNITQYDIRSKAALTEQVNLFVGPDSGPMHIAGALNTKGLILFGSIPPESRINYYPSLKSITIENLACLGCGYAGCPINIKCMTSLKAEKVGNKILEMLNENI